MALAEKRLFAAAEDNDVATVTDLLTTRPGIRINWKNKALGGPTALHVAAQNGHDAIMRLLLAHPRLLDAALPCVHVWPRRCGPTAAV